MAKAIRTKVKKPVAKVIEPEAIEVNTSKPGWSNVAPDSAQAKPYKRNEVLPSQINKE